MGSDAGGREVDVVAIVVDGTRLSCSKCASAQPSLLVGCFVESRQDRSDCIRASPNASQAKWTLLLGPCPSNDRRRAMCEGRGQQRRTCQMSFRYRMPAEGGVGRQVRSRRPCRIRAAGAAGDASGGAEGETQRGRRERTGGGGEERCQTQCWQRVFE